MKMISLRSLVSIVVLCLGLANVPPGLAAADSSPEADTPAPKNSKGPEGLGKLPEEAAPEAVSKDAKSSDSSNDKDGEAEKPKKKKGFFGKAKESEDSAEAAAADDKDSKSDEKDGKKGKQPPPPTAAELQAAAAAAERAKVLKTMSTPFNTTNNDARAGDAGLSPLSLRSSGNSLRSSLSQRLVPFRVYLPGKMMIGQPHEFVVKGRAGSHVAIAMADKDSGAKPIQGHALRLGPDRRLMAAGTIPESGILTLIVDMPIQGDLIGLPVFFETAIWQKPDFSDLEIAAPVKSETVEEFADKPNAVVVASGPGSKGRGIRFVPESAVPLHQRGSVNLESGRP